MTTRKRACCAMNSIVHKPIDNYILNKLATRQHISNALFTRRSQRSTFTETDLYVANSVFFLCCCFPSLCFRQQEQNGKMCEFFFSTIHTTIWLQLTPNNQASVFYIFSSSVQLNGFFAFYEIPFVPYLRPISNGLCRNGSTNNLFLNATQYNTPNICCIWSICWCNECLSSLFY